MKVGKSFSVRSCLLITLIKSDLRNIRPELPWEVTVKHLNNFCQRMKASGYNENYRLQILKAGMTGYDRMLEVERAGGRPVNQPRSWDEDNRQKKKALQSKTWYRKGGFDVPLFVPCTPGGELAKRMTRMEELNNQGRSVRFRIDGGGVLPWKRS